MIYGIGTDSVELKRVEKMVRKGHFSRFFTKREAEEIRSKGRKSTRYAAGNYAVKESVAKALRTGFDGMSPNDIEVFRDDLGAPFIKLSKKALKLFRERALSEENVHVSITDTKTVASAVAVIEKP